MCGLWSAFRVSSTWEFSGQSSYLPLIIIDLWTHLVFAGTGKSDEKVDLTRENKLAQFNNWFTWCHNCRHGGHAGHMLSWFRWDSLDATRLDNFYDYVNMVPAMVPVPLVQLIFDILVFWNNNKENIYFYTTTQTQKSNIHQYKLFFKILRVASKKKSNMLRFRYTEGCSESLCRLLHGQW